jgi:hypothetical protein
MMYKEGEFGQQGRNDCVWNQNHSSATLAIDFVFSWPLLWKVGLCFLLAIFCSPSFSDVIDPIAIRQCGSFTNPDCNNFTAHITILRTVLMEKNHEQTLG